MSMPRKAWCRSYVVLAILAVLLIRLFQERSPAAAVPACDRPAGSIDDSFFRVPDPVSFLGAALGTAELSDGRILVGLFGTISSGGSNPIERGLMARLNPDGTLDPSFTFQPGDLERVWQVHMFGVAKDGTIAAATSGVGTEGFYYGHFYILRPDGSTVYSATTGVDSSTLVHCLAWQADDRLLIGGNYRLFLPSLPAGLARLHEDGSLDSSFAPPAGFSFVTGLCVQPDGRILALDNDTLYRLQPDGSLDASFTPARFENLNLGYSWGPHRAVPVVLQPDGKILVASSFTGVNGVPRASVVRLHADGSVDATFNPGQGPGEAWLPDMDLVLQPDGRMIVTGYFTSFNDVHRSGVVRLRADGAVDLAFDAGASFNAVGSVTLLREGRSLVTVYAPGFGGNMWPYRLLGDPGIRLATPEFLGDGQGRLRINSVPGERYLLQASANLATWQNVATNSATDCQLAFTNRVVSQSVQFYRVRRF